MKTKIEKLVANNPNPVLSVEKDGTILYSNEAGEPLLKEWGKKIGEKLPSSIEKFMLNVISQNNPERNLEWEKEHIGSIFILYLKKDA